MVDIGQEMDGKYLVVRRLGGGGFGQVFLASDEAIPGRQVAIKVLDQSQSGEHRDLVWEMRNLAQFTHPHIITFYHHFTDADRLCLVMEFCPGGSLHDRLLDSGPWPLEQVFSWASVLCEALAFVHAKGIVHHDIKPPNVLFSSDRAIKLGDFGVANRNAGTRLYLPPEMLLGEHISRTDPRVDVYSLGLTIQECLVGHHPFLGLDDRDSLRHRMAHDFVPRDFPRWVQEVLLKATHPTPELRFQSAGEFGEAIESGHVPYVVDAKRIRAHALAESAEEAMRRRKWRRAEALAMRALDLSPDCVAALLAAGRHGLLLRRIDQASQYLNKAVSLNPRAQVQRELGWVSLEEGNIPKAISLLSDHLLRNASDYEAYNLLMKCYYLTDRFEAAADLGETLIREQAPSQCFYANRVLCRLVLGEDPAVEVDPEGDPWASDPFIAYNCEVAHESPRSWQDHAPPLLKSKLLFEEYPFGTRDLAGKQNVLGVSTDESGDLEVSAPIVAIGSMSSNHVVLERASVSRRHLAIVNYPGNVWIHDLDSTGGTSIAGERLVGRRFLDGVHEVNAAGVRLRIAARAGLLI